MRLRNFAVVTSLTLSIVACSSAPDSEQATEVFADCLERHGIEAENVEVTLNSDGSVESISVNIISEDDVDYEPTVRLACTEEVELDQ